MQMVKKGIGGFFLLVIFLILFSPKQEIYYLLEKRLEKDGIVISNEKFSDTLFGLTISDADIFVKGINMAKVKSLKLNIFFLYNQLSIESIETDKGIHKMAPKSIDNITATLSILKPYKVGVDAVGSFGSTSGGYYIGKNKLFFRLKEKKDISSFRKFLKKDKEGLFYEKFFR
ncbi:hypothetical protein MNB_SV-12-1017 [hydrothermal vent metagenome]|uniref:Uncharacterized protein n=1 Tax=hydrothermal vent metagenome TaxID=652676 RepID=A0A1W1C2Z0_9ZZZZ